MWKAVAGYIASSGPPGLHQCLMQAFCRLTLKCGYSVLDMPVREKAFPDRVAYTIRKTFNVNGNPRGIHECPEWGCNAESFALFDLMR